MPQLASVRPEGKREHVAVSLLEAAQRLPWDVVLGCRKPDFVLNARPRARQFRAPDHPLWFTDFP
jgi:hypothetical protein